MSGGNKIVGLRRDSDSAADAEMSHDEELLLEEYYSSDGAPDLPTSRGFGTVRTALIAAGLLWVAFYAWWSLTTESGAQSIEQLPQWIATLCVPLLLIGVAYLVSLRSSRAEANRFAQTANRLKQSTEALEQRLAVVRQQISSAHSAMQEQAALLESYGASASANLEASAKLISGHAAEAAQHTANAERAGTELANQITDLVRALPGLEERANAMSAQLMESSQAMTGRIDALERRLQAVMAISDDARLRTLSATKSLTTQLAQLQEETRSASDEINGMAEAVAVRIDAALAQAKAVLEETGTGLEGHATSLKSLIDESNTALAALGGDSLGRFSEQTAEMELRLQELNRLVEVQGSLSAGLTDDLSRKLQELEGLFSSLETEANGRTERLSATLAALSGEAERMDGVLKAGNVSADQLADRADSLLKTLSTSIGEMEAHYPEALSRLDGRIEESRALLGQAGPDIGQVEEAARRILENSREAQGIIGEQNRSLTQAMADMQAGLAASRAQAAQVMTDMQSDLAASHAGAAQMIKDMQADMTAGRAQSVESIAEMQAELAANQAQAAKALADMQADLSASREHSAQTMSDMQAGLAASRAQAEQLRAELTQAQDNAARLTESAGPQLVTALLRVKDTADQATERAREALSRAIPEAVHGLGEASEQAIRQAVERHAAQQIEQLSLITERAVEAAHQASERLNRQMHSIEQASAAIEKRIEEAEQAGTQREQNSVGRRSAQIIESLNSTAIDVTKVLTSDVSDNDWAAYLKGDRGVFTRQAVRLLNMGQAREIGLQYDSSAEFREHVNRYIHDFEALIRMVLAGRDGNAMAVTMLSSDMGKLYVALAQAIDRLGN